VSYACEKSMKATCNLGLFLGFSFLAACLRCLRINRGCRVLLPGKKPNCVSGILPFFMINVFLNQDSYRLLKFVSDLVSIFDTG